MASIIDTGKGAWCVLRLGRRHLVLMRPNFIPLGHLGLELMIGLRLARRFQAPLWIFRPDQVVDSAPYELIADDVKIRVFKGWACSTLTWIFFRGHLMDSRLRKTEPLLYGTPLYYLLTYRFGLTMEPVTNWWADLWQRFFKWNAQRKKERSRRQKAKAKQEECAELEK